MTQHAAVTFNPEAFAAWLDAPIHPREGTETHKDVSPLLRTAYQRQDSEGGWLAETTLDMLRTAPEPAPWTYGPDVTKVTVWTVAAPEGLSDGIAAEVHVDGFVVSAGQIKESELIPGDAPVLPGYEAAQMALAALAERVNLVVSAFRTRLTELTDVVDAELID